jgi:chemotaxis methyl-accepting protein methylase
MQYVYSVPTVPSFTDKGLVGYDLGPLNLKDFELIYVDSNIGHDKFILSKKITRIYFIVSGNGHFTINNGKYDVGAGMIVEIPPKVEYCYSGKMKLIVFSTPRWFGGNDTFPKWNPDVVPWGDLSCAEFRGSWFLAAFIKWRIFGKSPLTAFLRLTQKLWNQLPISVSNLGPISYLGQSLHRLARINDVRVQSFNTHFFQNRPQLELIRRLAERSIDAEVLKVAVLGCSIGAEAYSIASTIRSARPELKLAISAVDISDLAVNVGRRGVYSRREPKLTNTDLFRVITAPEIDELFDFDGETLTVKSWIKEGIDWYVGDVGRREVLDTLGPQDIVIANNFLCHMDDLAAERCLRNIARSVGPNGFLFVSGIELGIRTKVAKELGWEPLPDLVEEIHAAEPLRENEWPCHYAALEPCDKKRHDWRIRYATAFRIPSVDAEESSPRGRHARNQVPPGSITPALRTG